MANTFSPTVSWYFKVLAIILVFCIAAFFALSWTAKRLPPSYQVTQPAAEITPWLN